MKSTRRFFVAIATLLLVSGCVSGVATWEEVRNENTAAAYHSFLRESPKAPQVGEARERLAAARLTKNPTVEGFVEFREKYPQSELLAEVRPLLEQKLFELARAEGTREAYSAYLADFPTGASSERAKGNSEYLAHRGFEGRPADLAAFAKRYPTSDFSEEAQRSVASLDIRRRSALRRIGLVLEIAPGTPGAARLQRSFTQRALRHYASMSAELVSIPSANDPRAGRVDGILTIRHREERVRADYSVADATTAGVKATTLVTLARPGEPDPIYSEEFHFKVSLSEHREDQSILFGVTGSRFWDDFYFPAATWSTQNAARVSFPLPKPAVAVDAEPQRAVALFEDGGFVAIDISDPARPRITGRYTRPRDLSKWSGVRIRGSRVAIFGEAGVEVIELASGIPKRVLALDRAAVGGIVAVEPVGSEFLLAGSRGILLAMPGGSPQLLIDKPVLAAAMRGDRLLFADAESMFAASLDHLRKQKAEGQLRLRKGFGVERMRVVGDSAVLFGENGFAVVDVRDPRRLALRTRINSRTVGQVTDAVPAAGRIFILGDRGLQVADPRSPRIDDSIDVEARDRIGVAGRHLVMIGDQKLQVVDTTPFTKARNAAAPHP